MSITKSYFGTTTAGETVELYTLTNAAGMQVGILTYGGVLTFLKVPDRQGRLTDIVLGFDTIEEYEQGDAYFGALIGRCANRIDKGQFSLNGRDYTLFCNDKGNHLHGGQVGFDRRIWTADVQDERLVLSLVSPDGEEGYPGTMRVSVVHSLSDDGTLTWEYHAESDRDTLCNLTNHAYFNLAGHASGSVLRQMVQIESDTFTDAGEGLIPNGALLPVVGTPMDFREPHAIGERICADYEPLHIAGGYDHNYAVRGETGTMRDAATAFDEQSGIAFRLRTTMPGVQLYTGNFLENVVGKGQALYKQHSGFCLETQYFPDAINHPQFEQPILKVGEAFHHTTTLRFEIMK